MVNGYWLMVIGKNNYKVNLFCVGITKKLTKQSDILGLLHFMLPGSRLVSTSVAKWVLFPEYMN